MGRILRFAGLFSILVACLLSSAPAGAKGLLIRLQARDVSSKNIEPAKPVGPADDPDGYVFSCPSKDLKDCVALLFREQEGVSPETGEPVYSEASVEIHQAQPGGRAGGEIVWASVYSPWFCGAQNCPILAFRKAGPNSWEQVIDEHGVGFQVLPLDGPKVRPWFAVDTHVSACETWLNIYRPVGRGYEHVMDEELVGGCTGPDPVRSAATPRGVKYVTRLCPNLSREPEDDNDVPRFETWVARPDEEVVFSEIEGCCDGWPAADEFNKVFVIHGGDAGPVAAGYGVAWRGVGDAVWTLLSWLMGHVDAQQMSEDPVNLALMKADNFKTPTACGRKGCHRVARRVAPGIAAIDWYPASKNPSHPIHSEFLLVPEWLED